MIRHQTAGKLRWTADLSQTGANRIIIYFHGEKNSRSVDELRLME